MEFEGRRRFRVRLNMVPLINVIFLLLIFFMLAGTVRAPEPFGLVIPESESGDTSQVEPLFEPVELVLSVDGRLELDGVEILRTDLAAALAKTFADGATPAVTFKVDARADTGEMVDLLRELRGAGAKLVLLATRPPKSE